MEQLASSKIYQFHEDGSFYLTAQDECHIEIDEHIHVQLYITYDKEHLHQQLSLKVQPNAVVHALFLNDKVMQGSYQHHIEVMRDAQLYLGYGELHDGVVEGDIACYLKETGAKVNILHASLVNQMKHFKMICEHLVPHTEGIMNNYAVVSNAGNYRMEATGKIVKGASRSASHQHTHVLTMSDKHRSEVIPLLLIDENDVEASHAMSLGQPDSEQLYYLQSRGLNYQQALGLLMLGYILPLSELLKDDVVKSQLQELIEKKVGLYV